MKYREETSYKSWSKFKVILFWSHVTYEGNMVDNFGHLHPFKDF